MENATAFITGAASGIGEAAAIAFGDAGYRLILADRDVSSLKRVADRCEQEAGAFVIECDVSDEDSVSRCFETVLREVGHIDAAFNNAGIEGVQAPVEQSEIRDFDKVLAVNLRGVWLCMRAELRLMKPRRAGAIVNTSSVAGLVGLPGMAAYCASKHGVIGLTKAAALEAAADGIRVNAICPGAIETPMLDRFMAASPEGQASTIANEPIGRIGQPVEVAAAALWLCSEAASFVTGQSIGIDGGWTAR